MKVLPGRRRVAFAVILAAVLAGLAAGLLVGRAHSGDALAQGSPRVLAKGTFRSVTWKTAGTASLVREPSGDLRLRLSRDFTTKHAPELFVYLAGLRGQQRVYWKPLGALKSSRGAQQYTVSGVPSTPGLQVAIYCGECNQINGLAALQQVPATS
jgi:hypothetical protein